MAEYYEKINWKNGADGGTPLNAENLNRMEEGISGAEMRTGPLEYDKESDTFSAGDKIQLDANGNLRIAGDLQDMNGNSLLGGGGNSAAMPFYVGEAYVQLVGGQGNIDFSIEGLTEDDIDTEIEPLISTKYNVEIIRNGYGGFDTWYYGIELKTNNSWLSNSRVKVKFLFWKK